MACAVLTSLKALPFYAFAVSETQLIAPVQTAVSLLAFKPFSLLLFFVFFILLLLADGERYNKSERYYKRHY